MRIVIGFIGGCMDDEVLAGDSEQRTSDGEDAINYYCDSKNGQMGRCFSVPHLGGFQVYDIVRRLENGRNVILRARHVDQELAPAELEEIMVRR